MVDAGVRDGCPPRRQLQVAVAERRWDQAIRLFHEADVPRCLVDLRAGQHPELRERFSERQLERFIGVIYRPDTERWSHYSEAELPGQFDAYIWFERTQAITPLSDAHGEGMPDTWPFAM